MPEKREEMCARTRRGLRRRLRQREELEPTIRRLPVAGIRRQPLHRSHVGTGGCRSRAGCGNGRAAHRQASETRLQERIQKQELEPVARQPRALPAESNMPGETPVTASITKTSRSSIEIPAV